MQSALGYRVTPLVPEYPGPNCAYHRGLQFQFNINARRQTNRSCGNLSKQRRRIMNVRLDYPLSTNTHSVSCLLLPDRFGVRYSPLAIMQRLPIGKGDTLVNLGPGRDKRLPTIYQTKKHPKYKGPGRIFYFIQDLKKSALKQIAILEKSLKIPHGTHQDAIDKGMAFILALCHCELTHNRRVSPPA